MSHTLALIKPDAFERRIVGEILRRIEVHGFRFDGIRMLSVDDQEWNPYEFYRRQHEGKEYFGRLVNFMCSGPSLALILSHDTVDAIAAWRILMGSCRDGERKACTIRGDLMIPGEPIMRNLVHGSDSQESFEAECTVLICLENVQEFRDWGPLGKDNRPNKLQKGFTYRRFKGRLRALGYVVEDRLLRACDYGSPTTRERLFLVARCDGKPIIWPTPTHSKDGLGGLKPWRTAAECIDFSLPCPSIFLTSTEAKVINVRRPLADKTLRRIARGIDRFVVRNPKPYIVKFQQNSVGQPLEAPIDTVMSGATRFGLVAPTIVPVNHGGDVRCHSVEDPLRTITGAHRGEHALVAPFLAPRYGERPGQDPRCLSVDQPSPVIVPTQNGGSLCTAYLAKHYGGHEATGSQLTLPIDTITARDHNALVTSNLVKLRGECHGADVEQPAPALTAQGTHLAEVRAFLTRYNGTSVGQQLDLPSSTIDATDRLGLVMVDGHPHVITDIGMRMLIARELFRCQGFPDSYQIDVECERLLRGKLERSRLPGDAQVRMVGNSVPPQLSMALAAANAPDLAREDVA